MDISRIYDDILARVRSVDFSALWQGFHPLKFALYTESECFFDGEYIEKTDDFCANTAIEFRGENIAIWQLDGEVSDLDGLAASMIHEMFHAYQRERGESRWADEMEALAKYEYSADNLSMKLIEAGLMRAAVENDDRGAYLSLVSLRKRRSVEYPYEYDYEARIEQIEGSATYVELAALGQLDVAKARERWGTLLERIASAENYLPIRIISYEIGAALLACAKKFSTVDVEAFDDRPFAVALLDEPCEADAPAAALLGGDACEVDELLKAYADETHRIVAEAVAKNDCVPIDGHPLVSVNIWDARREGRFVTSSYFVMYRDGDQNHVIDGDFVLELDDDRNILNAYRR